MKESEDYANESGARCMMGEQARAEHRVDSDEKPIMEICSTDNSETRRVLSGTEEPSAQILSFKNLLLTFSSDLRCSGF